MKEILRTYNSQFLFEPAIVNEHLIAKNFKHIVLCGMGGSHLSAGLLKMIEPGIDIYVHRDYDLPPFSKIFLESGLLIASSYSGNTEEVVSFYKKIKQLYDLPVLVIAQGGELLELARANNDPYIQLPQTEFVPRTALGITTCALASVYKDKKILNAIRTLQLDLQSIETTSIKLAEQLIEKTPIFYASNSNLHLAYNWKIKFNETAKKIAFYNVFPESNHNELESYEFDKTAQNYIAVLFIDSSDHPRIKKRFEVFKEILNKKSIQYLEIDISHSNNVYKIFNTIVLGDFVTDYIASRTSVPSSEVLLIEEFKKHI